MSFLVEAGERCFIGHQTSGTFDTTGFTPITRDMCGFVEPVKVGNFAAHIHSRLILASDWSDFFGRWLPAAFHCVDAGQGFDSGFETRSFAREVAVLSRTADY